MAMELLSGALIVVLAALVYLLMREKRPAVPQAPPPPSEPARNEPTDGLGELAGQVSLDGEAPQRMAEDPDFVLGARHMKESAESSRDLAARAHPTGTQPVLACMALEALALRGEDPETGELLLRDVGRVRVELLYFYLRALRAMLPREPLVGDVLLAVAANWDSGAIRNFSTLRDVLRQFVVERVAHGERPVFEDRYGVLNHVIAADLRALVDRINVAELAPLAAAVDRWSMTKIDTEELAKLGRVWSGETDEIATERVVPRPEMEPVVHEVLAALSGERVRSVVLLGEPGAGKATVARVALQRMQRQGWTVFEAGSTELQAGTSLIGELETRLLGLAKAIDARRKVVWFIPDFGNLAWVGQHRYNPVGALDRLLPDIERGRIALLGVCPSAAFEELTRATPGIAAAVRCVRVEPADEAATLDLARRWIAAEAEAQGVPAERLVPDAVLREAWQLAEQYLRDRVPPGHLLTLLKSACRRLSGPSGSGPAPRPLSTDDLITTLGEATGLPASILDERQTVDLEALRKFFEQRVMGQREAIDCLVERVAMIKAGVTDPTRPAGVFLFAGPTGTGKTEIAKSLAEFLFGSEQRMVRLDMSEMGTYESLSRILGSPGEYATGREGSLVEAIRKQPFAVILLDEFEKAHPAVWDLFLQVFDDGRLTDRRGAVADFRHAIVILTSNLGVSLPMGASLGFTGKDGEFRTESVVREIDRSFRREFVNRLDRIVVFRPLGRDTMREILRREIDLALQRRGLRNRRWAVEWEPPALEFLLEQGFTPDLGARPLRRAIERYFLAPLATTIVNHHYPKGDQFLFVRAAGGSLEVVFVDPDAPESETVPGAEQAPELPAGLDAIVLQARGTPAELDAIEARLAELCGRVEQVDWEARKRDLMVRMGAPAFWDSPGRFAVLGEIEFLDRIEASIESTRSLLARLGDPEGRRRTAYPQDVVRRLGQQVYLLDAATLDLVEGRPRDAFVEVDAGFGSGGNAEQRNEFARRIGGMYGAWASRRGMQLDLVDESDANRPYRARWAVSGFGAYAILSCEEGIHVHEAPEDEGGHAFRKCAIHVRVAPQPEVPAAGSAGRDRTAALRAQAEDALAARGRDGLAIVRRYRERPSPLVRDEVRGWRTGRIEAVFEGGFDVMT